MIVGCYSLQLYCQYSEEPGCPYRYSREPAQFGAGCETGAKAREQARRRGWVLDRKAMTAVCPACAKRKLTTVA